MAMAVLGGVVPAVPVCRNESAEAGGPHDPPARFRRAEGAGRFASDGLYRMCRAGR